MCTRTPSNAGFGNAHRRPRKGRSGVFRIKEGECRDRPKKRLLRSLCGLAGVPVEVMKLCGPLGLSWPHQGNHLFWKTIRPLRTSCVSSRHVAGRRLAGGEAVGVGPVGLGRLRPTP